MYRYKKYICIYYILNLRPIGKKVEIWKKSCRRNASICNSQLQLLTFVHMFSRDCHLEVVRIVKQIGGGCTTHFSNWIVPKVFKDLNLSNPYCLQGSEKRWSESAHILTKKSKKNTGRCFRKVSMSFLWIHDSLVEYWQEVVHVRYKGHEQKKNIPPSHSLYIGQWKILYTLNNSYHSWRCCLGGCFFAPRHCSHGGKFASICDQVVEEIQKLMTVSQPKHHSWDFCCQKSHRNHHETEIP